jgi:hypothetical protein
MPYLFATGLKKCRPISLDGVFRKPDSFSSGIAEVLVARMA